MGILAPTLLRLITCEVSGQLVTCRVASTNLRFERADPFNNALLLDVRDP